MTKPEPTALTESDVLHVAKLARLDLQPEEVGRMTAELSAIVGYVRTLDQVDTANVPPTTQVQIDAIAFRPDEPHLSLSREAILTEAPRSAHDGFAVPGFVED
jgi:aspartyl-tRNA(Asn)/glutamyl-tRNA(Gln) amidotransferase subunit C